MNHPRLTWERLVAHLALPPEEINSEPPFGFATSMVAQWRALHRNESLRRWASWSFRTALASVAACSLFGYAQIRHDSSILLPLPEPPALTDLPTHP